MGYNAIEIDGDVKLDLSQDTVTEETLPEGVTAHNADGDPIEGKMKFVKSINSKTGDVELNASDVGARPANWMPTASDVGARPNDWMPTASEVGARPADWMPTYSQVGAEKAGNVNTHNTNGAAHNDIRVLIAGLSERINAVLDSDDETLDELSEIVAYIKANETLIESVTTSKVNVSDIVDSLESTAKDQPLSANQGSVLWGWLVQLVEDFGAALNEKADKSESVFFIQGGGTTDTTNKVATWTGSHEGITAYYDGLMIAYKVGTAGSTTTTLNINSLGAIPVVKNATSAVSTSFPVNSVVFLVYTVDSGTAYWKAHDYDANTKNSAGSSEKTGTKMFLVGATSQNSSGVTTYSNSNVYIDASNVLNSEKGFKGDLTGNAATATKATQDGNGNVITSTYEPKANATAKYAELENKITNAGGDNVPDYIVAEAERVANAVQAVRTSKTLVFSAMTDIHLYADSTVEMHINSLTSAQSAGAGLKEIQKRMNLDFCALLGDYSYMSSADYSAAQTMKDIMLARKTLGISGDKEIWCVGNHDWCYGTGVDRMLTEDELYGYIGANSDGTKPYESIERCYGYLDFDNQKIRVIYLNTNDCKDGIDNGATTKDSYGYMEFISPTQMRWLADVALDFSDKSDAPDWATILASHHPADYGYGWYKQLLQILEAYREKKSITLWVTDYIKDGKTTGHNETFDFTSVESPADIICNIHGHIHNCASKMVSSQPDSTQANYVTPWLWRFCVPNMCYGRYNEKYNTVWGEVDSAGNKVVHEKVMGTEKETSFNIVSIDRKYEKIYAHIFGAGIDRVINYKQAYQPKVYSISVSVNNCTGASGNPISIVEAGTASLTFTANSGYVLPDSVTVTGATYTWDKASGTLVLSVPTGDVSVNVAAEKNVVNLINMSQRTYVQYSQANGDPQFIAANEHHEMDYTKLYASDPTGKRGYYPVTKITYTPNVAENGFTYKVSSSTGYGLEFPVNLVGGKTYKFAVDMSNLTSKVQVVKYNVNNNVVTYDSMALKIEGGSTVTQRKEFTFTVEDGYLYSIFFNGSVTSKDMILTNISLTEA